MPDAVSPLSAAPANSAATPIQPRNRLLDIAWLLFWGIASSVWCLTAAGQLSATFDEPLYVKTGLQRWRSGSTTALMQMGTMPLPVDVETLPLYLWERWQGTQLDPVDQLPKLLPWARAFTLVFWWMLLIHVGLAARSLAGPWAGRLAVALLACEPTFLAHAGLATTDVAVTACLLALLYHFRANRDGPWLRRVAWPALWFALAVLAKASGLVFGVLCLLVVEMERRLAPVWDAGRGGVTPPLLMWSALWKAPARGSFRRDLAQIFGIGLVLVFVYCGSDWQPQASALEWARKLPEGPGSAALVWGIEHARVFSNAGEAIARQVSHNVRGHGVYIVGQVNDRSLWYYFPVALSIKLSEPLLVLPLLLLVIRARTLRNWAVLAALALLLFSVTCRVQIGVRFMLPLAALAVVGVSAAAVRALQSFGPGWRSRAGAGFCAAAVLWSAVSAATVWPDGLCYVNEFWGGTAEGHRWVSESNYDWGQGLKELAHWQKREGGAPLDVWYFGSDPRYRAMPFQLLALHAMPIAKPDDVLPYVRGRRLAVSTTFVHGWLYGPAGLNAQAFLAARRPVARTSTFLIYDFTNE